MRRLPRYVAQATARGGDASALTEDHMLALGAFEAQAVKVRWQGEHSREVVFEATATCFRGWVGEGIADRSQYKSHALRRNFSKYMCAVPRVETKSPFSVVPPLKISLSSLRPLCVPMQMRRISWACGIEAMKNCW